MADDQDDILKVIGINSKGYGTFPKIVAKDRRLSPEAKCIYAYFCSYAGAGSTAFPKVKTITFDLNMSEDRYYRHFKPLEEFGYISVEKIRGKDGRWLKNIYELLSLVPDVGEPEADKTPPPQNKGMEPYPQNPDLDKPDKDNPCTDNTGTNINSFNINNVENNNSYNQSVSLSEEKYDDGLTDGPEKILENIDWNYLKEQKIPEYFLETIPLMIENMWYLASYEINGATLPNRAIRNVLEKLNHYCIEFAFEKFDEYSRTGEVKNSQKYFQAILFNSVHESLAMRAHVNYNALGNGKKKD